MRQLPKLLDDVISVSAAILPNCRSSGVATADAMVSGLAPGSPALTLMVGKSTRGNGATGNCVNAAPPASRIATARSGVAMGRRMNGAEIFTARPRRARAAADRAARWVRATGDVA